MPKKSSSKPAEKKKIAPVKTAPAKKAKPKAAGPKQLSDAEKLQLVEKVEKKAKVPVLLWLPDKLVQFSKGQSTLAELEGISDQKLYHMATIAYNLMNQGKLDSAEKIFAGLAVLNPYDAYFQLALGSVAQRQENWEEAESRYSRAIEINASIIPAYANRGEVRIVLGKLTDAIGDFAKAIVLDGTGKDQAALRARAMMAAIQQKIKDLQAGKARG